MKHNDNAWERLAAIARTAPQETRPEEAPHGFSTRVAALWLDQPASIARTPWELLAWRGLGVSFLLAMAVATTSLTTALETLMPDNGDAALADPVAELFEIP